MIGNLITFARHAPSLSIGLVFMVNSFLFGNWITRIPYVQNNLGISEGQLGIALLAVSVGGLAMMPFMSWIIGQIGTGRATIFSTFFCCLAMVLPVAMPGYNGLLLALLLIGIAIGAMDVAMNAAAAAIEKEFRLSIMSTCHGMFSLGGFIGAPLGSLLVGLEIDPVVHMSAASILMILLLLILIPHLWRMPDIETDKTVFTLPRGPLLLLALIGFCVMLGEGAVADWSAVYLQNTLQSSPYLVGMGYAGFSLTMTVGRFYGDQLVPQWGVRPIVQYGSLIGALGIATAILIPQPITAILGFTAVGLGFSCVVPILFSASAKMPGTTAGTGIASVTTMGILGFLIGPPVIGLLAEQFGLRMGLGFVMFLAFIAYWAAGRIKLE